MCSSKLKAQSINKNRLRPALLSAFSPAGTGLFAAISDNPASSVKRGDPQAQQSSDDAQRALRIVVAGGGTGGHLFPGIAIAQEFVIRNSATRIIFISTGNPLEKSVIAKTDFEL